MNILMHVDVLKIFPELKPRTLISWSEKELFLPAVKAEGTGTRRVYSLKNLVEIGVIRELVSYGAPRQLIARVMEQVSKSAASEENGFDLVIVARERNLWGDHSGNYNLDIWNYSWSQFVEGGVQLIFDNRRSEHNSSAARWDSYFGSVIVISLGHIWEYIKERL